MTNEFDDNFEMSNIPESETGYFPAKNDAEDYKLLVDDSLDSRIQTFSKNNGFSLGLHQKMLRFKISCIKAGIEGEAFEKEFQDDFATAEKLSPTACKRFIKFDAAETKRYHGSIEEIQKISLSLSKRPNPNAHKIHQVKNSKAFLDANHPEHDKIIKKMISLCGKGKNNARF